MADPGFGFCGGQVLRLWRRNRGAENMEAGLGFGEGLSALSPPQYGEVWGWEVHGMAQ